MRPRCTFQYVGRPTTAPNTPADAKRIELSQWLTRLIGDGDSYVTPGAKGYSPDALASAPKYYAHLLPKEVSPSIALSASATMQSQSTLNLLQAVALEKLREGIPSAVVIKETKGLSGVKLAEWRKDPAFAAQWDAAKAEGRKAPSAQPLALGSTTASATPAQMLPFVTPLTSLITCGSEKQPLTVLNPGDVVFLRSGSPRMTVDALLGGMALCVWYNEAANHFVKEQFAPHLLEAAA